MIESSPSRVPRSLPSRASRICRLFVIDTRSLALFRILIASVLIGDLLIRLTDLSAMYADRGMFPRSLIAYYFPSIWNWSFHFASGSAGFQFALFILALLFAFALLFGYHTRLATVGSWILLISLHNRLPGILSGGDNLLRMLLFFGIFLPLGKCWSWDARRQGDRGSLQVGSVASAAILVQMALMYGFSAAFKSTPEWWNGKALAGILSHDFYAQPLARFLLDLPSPFLTLATYTILGIEWIGPFLLFVSTKKGRLRMAVISLFLCMHLGIMVSLSVGIFSWVCVAGLCLFVPSAIWERFIQSAKPRQTDANGYSWSRIDLLPGVILFYVVFVNIASLPAQPLSALKIDRWEPFWTAWGFGQKWNMFSGIPSKDGWYVAQATLENGQEVDLLTKGEPITWERPEVPVNVYPNHRWAKVFREMAYYDELGYQVYRAPIGKYLCREWNKTKEQGEKIVSFAFYYCSENAETGFDKELLLKLEYQ